MLSQSFGTFGGRLFEPIKHIAFRIWDRYKGGCKWHLRKKTNIDIEEKAKADAEAKANKGKDKKATKKDEAEEEEYGEEEEGKEGGDIEEVEHIRNV